jgi:hypothetical protein
MIGNKSAHKNMLINALRRCMLHERAGNGLPIMEEVPSNIYQSCNNGKERNWVAMNIGTLSTNKERMLECIHMKLLISSYYVDLRL